MMTIDQVRAAAVEAAKSQGAVVLSVTVREAGESAEHGARLRVKVTTSDRKATCRVTRNIGRRLATAGAGRVSWDRHSHWEARMGSSPTTGGWLIGSSAELVVYPGVR